MMGARRRGLRDARAVCVISYACDDDYPSIYVHTRGLSYRVRDFTPIARARVVDRRRRSSSIVVTVTVTIGPWAHRVGPPTRVVIGEMITHV